MSFFISNAIAETATGTAAAPAGSNFASILMLVGFVVIFYFLLWRPQAKRAKDQRDLVASLAVGDEVVTSGGMLGKITKLSDDFIMVALADNVEVKMQKGAVISVLPKGTLKTL